MDAQQQTRPPFLRKLYVKKEISITEAAASFCWFDSAWKENSEKMPFYSLLTNQLDERLC